MANGLVQEQNHGCVFEELVVANGVEERQRLVDAVGDLKCRLSSIESQSANNKPHPRTA